ncbi:MAG: hypothetical protein DRP63_00230 [Planctomycetota bacterium]|nr:MAG: hypothetical protein DRP63_00230 [Planctomycetota bacterium]
MPCYNCPKRDICTQPCEELEKELPSMEHGKLHGGKIKAKDLQELVRRMAVVKTVLDYRDRLKGRQKQVIDLYFNDGLTQREIGKRLGIAQKNVCEYMKRAFRKIGKWAKEENSHEEISH